MNKKAFVGLSGGVDSSVAAALLKQKGYDVEGISLVLTPNDDGSASRDAKAVADALSIPLHIIDLKSAFAERVIDYFVEEYKLGRTPNPCIRCNETIKFGLMLEKALEMGANFLATGHYAKIALENGKYLLKAADSVKDQSYFLYRLNQDQLSHVLFPIADMEKEDTRAIARELGLPVADKGDSQEICFIPDNDYVKFIKEYSSFESVPGNFVDLNGNVIGQHSGIINYTIGQRKGLGVAFGEPMFVTKIDAKTNEVVLAPNGFQETSEFFVDNLSEPFTSECKLDVKIRYKASKVPATIIPIENGKVKVVFDAPQRAVTPGQSAVFYAGDTVVSGGYII
ncbi:MAG: tRNA 2-thiouridine(34) synthase MnmA [Oscillospiraceae bacterium]|nr:tRNA 2-thiouridine(34) synthase MnmA [Candidatus Limimonas egerieequi]